MPMTPCRQIDITRPRPWFLQKVEQNHRPVFVLYHRNSDFLECSNFCICKLLFFILVAIKCRREGRFSFSTSLKKGEADRRSSIKGKMLDIDNKANTEWLLELLIISLKEGKTLSIRLIKIFERTRGMIIEFIPSDSKKGMKFPSYRIYRP